MADPQNPYEALRASMEALRSWRGSEGDKREIRKATTAAIRLAQDLIEQQKVDLTIRLRSLTGHAHQAVSEYAYTPDPPGTQSERVVDGLQWMHSFIRLLAYIAIAGSPHLPSGYRQRRPVSGRYPPMRP